MRARDEEKEIPKPGNECIWSSFSERFTPFSPSFCCWAHQRAFRLGLPAPLAQPWEHRANTTKAWWVRPVSWYFQYFLTIRRLAESSGKASPMILNPIRSWFEIFTDPFAHLAANGVKRERLYYIDGSCAKKMIAKYIFQNQSKVGKGSGSLDRLLKVIVCVCARG